MVLAGVVDAAAKVDCLRPYELICYYPVSFYDVTARSGLSARMHNMRLLV